VRVESRRAKHTWTTIYEHAQSNQRCSVLPLCGWRSCGGQRFPSMERAFRAALRFPNVVDRFLVPATPEPLISCTIAGSAQFRERETGQAWLKREIGRGHIFVTRSKTPYEVCHTSPVGEELEVVQVHIAVDRFLAALAAAFPGKTEEVEVMDYSGRDEALAHLCFACAGMLSARLPGKSRRIAVLAQLFA
jgi:hypothetical protein